MKIEVLYFRGCPSWRVAWTVVGDALARTGVEATVELVDVAGLPESRLAGFAGSPTVRIDGQDLEGYEGPPLHACRRFASNGGKGWPSVEAVEEALQQRAESESPSRS